MRASGFVARRPDNWRNKAIPVQKVFTEVAKVINRFEPVTMGFTEPVSKSARDAARNCPRGGMSYNVLGCATADQPLSATEQNCALWIGSSMPGVVIGGLYFPWDLDDMVAQKWLRSNVWRAIRLRWF
jgi:agmatine deiminase